MARGFLAPNGVLIHMPALGFGTVVANAPTHTPQPRLQNNVAAGWSDTASPPLASNNMQPVSGAAKAPSGIVGGAVQSLLSAVGFTPQPSAPIPTPHATNMFSFASPPTAEPVTSERGGYGF